MQLSDIRASEEELQAYYAELRAACCAGLDWRWHQQRPRSRPCPIYGAGGSRPQAMRAAELIGRSRPASRFAPDQPNLLGQPATRLS
jgi:hypothetical protein